MSEGTKDQGGKHQERKPVLLSIFPLNKESVLTAFKNLDPRKDSSDVEKAVDKEIGILGRTNIYAAMSFGNLLDYYTKDVAVDRRRGNALCHQALRLGARGELPKFTETFVQAYDDEQEEMAEKELDDTHLQPSQVALAKRQENVARFREFEPKMSKVVERKLRIGLGWLPEEDQIYKGFMDLYFLFKEGCSDPKNFAESPHE